MNIKIGFGIWGVLLTGVSLAYAVSGEMPPQAKRSPEFERFKALVGTWEGTSAEHDGSTKPVKVEYLLSSSGTVVVEKLFTGTPHEMTSVYHDTKGELNMTHYCALGNHPELAFQNAEGNKYEFTLAPVNSIGADEPHMHALQVEFKDADHVVQTWTYYEQGKPQGSTVITLSRAP